MGIPRCLQHDTARPSNAIAVVVNITREVDRRAGSTKEYFGHSGVTFFLRRGDHKHTRKRSTLTPPPLPSSYGVWAPPRTVFRLRHANTVKKTPFEKPSPSKYRPPDLRLHVIRVDPLLC